MFKKKTPEYAQEPSRISSSIMNTKKFQKQSRKILKEDANKSRVLFVGF